MIIYYARGKVWLLNSFSPQERSLRNTRRIWVSLAWNIVSKQLCIHVYIYYFEDFDAKIREEGGGGGGDELIKTKQHAMIVFFRASSD